MTEFRILSNNQWKAERNFEAWAEKGLDSSPAARAPGFARMFAEVDADIIGLQECSATMADLHMQAFGKSGAGYALLWGRDTPILYKTSKFELADSAYMIYPTEVPGFDGEFNNFKTKSYCVAVLKSKENGDYLVFATTHLWYKSNNHDNTDYYPGSDEARTYQLGLLMDKVDEFVAKYNCPAVIVGDFNTREDSDTLKSAFDRGYLHARGLATDFSDGGHGLHVCNSKGFGEYTPKSPDEAIDHIIVKDLKATVKRFERYSPDYYMSLSDHLPVWIDIEVGG